VPMVKDKMFRFLWKNKKDKIKRTSMYQDLSTGCFRMVDIELTIKSLRLTWMKRLLFRGNCTCKVVPDYFFNKHGGINFLLRCNYDAKYSVRHILESIINTKLKMCKLTLLDYSARHFYFRMYCFWMVFGASLQAFKPDILLKKGVY